MKVANRSRDLSEIRQAQEPAHCDQDTAARTAPATAAAAATRTELQSKLTQASQEASSYTKLQRDKHHTLVVVASKPKTTATTNETAVRLGKRRQVHNR